MAYQHRITGRKILNKTEANKADEWAKGKKRAKAVRIEAGRGGNCEKPVHKKKAQTRRHFKAAEREALFNVHLREQVIGEQPSREQIATPKGAVALATLENVSG